MILEHEQPAVGQAKRPLFREDHEVGHAGRARGSTGGRGQVPRPDHRRAGWLRDGGRRRRHGIRLGRQRACFGSRRMRLGIGGSRRGGPRHAHSIWNSAESRP